MEFAEATRNLESRLQVAEAVTLSLPSGFLWMARAAQDLYTP